jgi:hypothetical protein
MHYDFYIITPTMKKFFVPLFIMSVLTISLGMTYVVWKLDPNNILILIQNQSNHPIHDVKISGVNVSESINLPKIDSNQSVRIRLYGIMYVKVQFKTENEGEMSWSSDYLPINRRGLKVELMVKPDYSIEANYENTLKIASEYTNQIPKKLK